MNLHHLPIRRQIIGLLLVALAFIALIGAIAIWALVQTRDLTEEGHEVTTPRQVAAGDLIDAVNLRAIGARNIVLAPDAEGRLQQRERVVRAHEKTNEAIRRLQAMTAANTSREERGLVDAVVAAEAEYGPVALEITEIASQGRAAEASRLIVTRCQPLLDRLIAASEALMKFENEKADRGFEDLARTESSALRSMGVLLASRWC